MSDIEDHRIYKHMNEPIRIIGLTIDELIISIICIFGFMQCIGNTPMMTIFLMGGTFGVFSLKSWKKRQKGIAIKSFLYWHGLWKKPSKTYTDWQKRGFLS